MDIMIVKESIFIRKYRNKSSFKYLGACQP